MKHEEGLPEWGEFFPSEELNVASPPRAGWVSPSLLTRPVGLLCRELLQ